MTEPPHPPLPPLFESLRGSELNNNRFEVSHVHKVECVVPWLNDTLVFFTISLQLCQQLKDKVGVSAEPRWANTLLILYLCFRDQAALWRQGGD